MDLITPQEITDEIDNLCQDLVEDPVPIFLDVNPFNGAQINDCFRNVERFIRRNGGEICYGWQIWEWPDIMIEAEFHSVWISPNGDLRDITPKARGVDQILFLEDPVRAYEGRQVNNIRRALIDNEHVHNFIDAADEIFEFENRGERADHHELHLTEEEAEEYQKIVARKNQAQIHLYNSSVI